MRSLIPLLLLLFSSLRFAAAQAEPAALPIFSHESNRFLIRVDKETLEFANKKLGERKLKLRQRQHDAEVNRRAPDEIDRPLVDMFNDLFRRLIQETQIVYRLAQGAAAVRDAFDPGWKHIEELPRFEDVNLQQAFREIIPIVGVHVQQHVPALRRPVFELSVVAITLLGMISIWHSSGNLLSHIISLNTNGVMGYSCPEPQFSPCNQQICAGAGTKCDGNSFLKDCECKSNNCPASDKVPLICDEKDCGGEEIIAGTCKGRQRDGQYRGCYCGDPQGFQTELIQSSLDELARIVGSGPSQPPTKDPDPPKDEPIIKDGSNYGECGGGRTKGDRGILSQPIDKNKLQRCLKNLALNANNGIWFDVGCEGLVRFHSGRWGWERADACYDACKNCLSQSIADGYNQNYCNAYANTYHCWMGYMIPDPPLSPVGGDFKEDELDVQKKDDWIDKYAAQECLTRLSWDNWFFGDTAVECDVGNGRSVRFSKDHRDTWHSARDCHHALIKCVSHGINQGGTTVWCNKWVDFAHCWFGMELVAK